MTGLFFFNRWRHQAEKNVGPSWRRHLPLSLASKITTKSRKEPTRFIDHAPSSVCWTAATNNSIEQGGSKSKRWRWSAHRSTPKRDRGLKLNLPVRTRRRAYFCSVWLLAFSFLLTLGGRPASSSRSVHIVFKKSREFPICLCVLLILDNRQSPKDLSSIRAVVLCTYAHARTKSWARTTTTTTTARNSLPTTSVLLAKRKRKICVCFLHDGRCAKKYFENGALIFVFCQPLGWVEGGSTTPSMSSKSHAKVFLVIIFIQYRILIGFIFSCQMISKNCLSGSLFLLLLLLFNFHVVTGSIAS